MTNRINTLRRFYLWSFFNPSLDFKKSLSQGSRLSWAFQTSCCLFKLRKLKIKETWGKSHLCKTITLENIVFDWACHISRVHLHTFTSFICMCLVFTVRRHIPAWRFMDYELCVLHLSSEMCQQLLWFRHFAAVCSHFKTDRTVPRLNSNPSRDFKYRKSQNRSKYSVQQYLEMLQLQKTVHIK